MRRTRPVAVSQHPLSRGFHASRASHNAQLAQAGEAFEKTPAGLSCGSSCVTRAPRSPTAPLRGTSPPPLCVHGFVFGGPPIAKNDDAMVAAIHGTRNPNARAVVWRVAEACARVGMRRSVSCTRREDAHVVSRSISHAFRRRFMAMSWSSRSRLDRATPSASNRACRTRSSISLRRNPSRRLWRAQPACAARRSRWCAPSRDADNRRWRAAVPRTYLHALQGAVQAVGSARSDRGATSCERYAHQSRSRQRARNAFLQRDDIFSA